MHYKELFSVESGEENDKKNIIIKKEKEKKNIAYSSLRNKRSFKNVIKKLRIFKPNNNEETSDTKFFDIIKNSLVYKDIEKLIKEFSKSITSEDDIKLLCMNILKCAAMTLKIERCSIFLVEENFEKKTKMLVEFIFDISKLSNNSDVFLVNSSQSGNQNSNNQCITFKIINCTLDQCNNLNLQQELINNKSEFLLNKGRSQFFSIPWGMGIIGKSAQTGNIMNIEDAYNV